MRNTPPSALAHYQEVLTLQGEAVGAARRSWAQVNPNAILSSWRAAAPSLVSRLRNIQQRAALAGATYGALTLADQGAYVAPEELADPDAFVGWMVNDDAPMTQVPLEGALRTQSFRALDYISGGMAPRDALASVGTQVLMVAATAVADAARQAAAVDIAARPGTGYVRMLNPPSCSRCVVLAGRFYRWNTGFRRHPKCDCIHTPCTVKSTAAAQAEGLLTDPYEYFNSLSAKEQEQVFTKYGAQAIRDGADVYQVVNARAGMAGATRVRPSTGGHRNLAPWDPRRRYTSQGTSRRSNYYRSGGGGRYRLTPEGIYTQARPREETIELLRQNGYILPAGQVPGGSILGPNKVGFGQMGHGGQRRAASDAVTAAIASGVRDQASVATMTAAERRVAYARRDWQLAASGIDPTSPGAVELRGGARIGGAIRPSTPEMAARYEKAYRYQLARGGQVYRD